MNTVVNKNIALTVALGSLLALAGCGNTAEDELRQWMADERAQVQPKITPIPPSKKFVPQAYTGDGAADPFGPQRLIQMLRNDAQASRQQALQSELNRRKEPLEAFPLDSLVFVGTLTQGGKTIALIKADNLLFQVQPGARLGQNNGQVMKIAESQITLREVLQDAAGEWIERPATLQLQERAK